MFANLVSLKFFCALCNQKNTGIHSLCHACYALCTPLGDACARCAATLPKAIDTLCGRCLKNTPAYNRLITAYRFDEPLRTLVHEFKYQEGLFLKDFLIHLMLEAMPALTYRSECLIPVPMHPKRLQQRGYNQAVILAQGLSRALSIPYNTSFCQKKVNTPAQASLCGEDREKNIKNVFIAKTTPYQHITLIDDVVTTGHTVNALAHAFLQTGVKTIDVWCCTRT